MTINDLHMTEEQIVNEIQFMRMWDKYLQKMLGKEKHSELSLGFARMLTSAELKSFGASDEEIEKACNFADMMAIADEHKADTPQTDWHYDEQDATWYPYKHEDEPQQKSCATCKHALGNWDGESNNCGRCCGADRRFYEPKTESQMERSE